MSLTIQKVLSLLMMTSKGREEFLYSLSFETTSNYTQNLQRLLALVEKTKENSIIVAPEVIMTGFDYEHFSQASAFAPVAIEALKRVSDNRTIVVTLIEERDGKFYNFAKVFHNGRVIYERAKVKLFTFGGEERYFQAGEESSIDFVEVNGIKIAILICFELRFKELWCRVEGADVIAVCAWWGRIRREHFRLLTQSLALVNQCYVVASDAQNEECSQITTIITPDATPYYGNGNEPCLKVEYKRRAIALMRRYMDVGIE